MPIAIIIDPEHRTVTPVEYVFTEGAVRKLLGDRPMDIAMRFASDDVMYVDDEGWYRDPQHFFALRDQPQRVFAGIAVIVGPEYDTDEPPGWGTRNARTDPGVLASHVMWLTRNAARALMTGSPSSSISWIDAQGRVHTEVTGTWDDLLGRISDE